MFETFEHKADIGIRGIGNSREEAFGECARAMFSVMANLEKVEAKEEDEVKAESQDIEGLLVQFLNELLYLRDVKERLYSRFDLYIINDAEGWKLNGKAFGESIEKDKHSIKTDVKAASYHQLKVEEKNGKWVAQCVVDT
ncbi:MAG: archease [Candidatus Diapherotrites archaeon]|uniref:Archease n=1 Tax=Candidatus Iainarchaeum sp. TaxID=3101447 RepID=A0A939C8U1_9ARCH|nr:archease [Candidatus Diapherotrites archaeon]